MAEKPSADASAEPGADAAEACPRPADRADPLAAEKPSAETSAETGADAAEAGCAEPLAAG
ncbi:hypothetical protein OHS18_34890 [Amycolatopsis sp. NBC_00355]|uniref:hypothetical protein n=1 Tax=Amycolatopsis sp. NBC_00355 TaxID=2975957 RepID=UPI002E25A203